MNFYTADENLTKKKGWTLFMAVTAELRDSIKKMQTGEAEAFATFYEQTYSYVYAKAKYIMHEEEDALDLTQETFIQAYRGIGSIEDINNVYAWLGGIVYRQGMRIFNKKKEVLTGEEEDYLFDEIVSEEATPDQSVEQQETVNIVKGMIDELPELQRIAVMAFYYDNMKIDDIAVMCECSPNTIKSRLNYAKKYLKEKVEEHEKQNNYKLYSVSPAIIILVFKSLFTDQTYKMPLEAVKDVYAAVCESLGIGTGSVISVAEGVKPLSEAAVTDGAAASGAAVAGETTSAAVTAAIGGVAAGAAKVGIGIKIGVVIATVAAIGGIGTAIVLNIDNNTKNNLPEYLEESGTVIYDSSTENPEETFSEEETDEQIYDESASMEGLYTYGDYTISITNAEVKDYRNATFDVEITDNSIWQETVDTLTLSQVSEIDGTAQINGTSDNGCQWMGNLWFMADGSIVMFMSKRTEEYGVYDLGNSVELMMFIKSEKRELITERIPEEGTYIFTEGNDVYNDGGYVLKISEVSEDVDTTFKMEFEIISDGGRRFDSLELDTEYVYMNDGIGTFFGTTGWGVGIRGYLYVNEDGSISLSYTSMSGVENVIWYGAYPDATFEPIVLEKE